MLQNVTAYLPATAASAAAFMAADINTTDQIDKDDDFVLLAGPQALPDSTAAASTALVEYNNEFLISRLARIMSAVTTTGARIVDGYRFPARVVVFMDPQQIPEAFYNSIQWMIDYQGFRLKSQHLTDYLKCVLAKTDQKVQIIFETLVLKADTGHTPSFYLNLWNLEQEQTKAEKPDILFIPFLYPRHIVMIEVNFKENKICYYDSQAVPPQDPGRNSAYDGFNMEIELDKLKKKAFGEHSTAQILFSRFVHQQDVHSCGVYCGDYIFRRLYGETFDQIDRHGKNAAEIEKTRIEQALNLSQANPDAVNSI